VSRTDGRADSPPQAGGLPHRARNRTRTVPVKTPPRKVELAKEPMKIQMLTDDPDLVIIWLVGEEGDSE
jgi:hypothetical protein